MDKVSRPAESQEGRSEFFSQFFSLPIVSFIVSLSTDLISKARSSIWIVGKASDWVESTFIMTSKMIQPVFQPMLDLVRPIAAAPLSKVDNLANKGLETLKRTVPVITKEPNEIVSDTKQMLNPAVERLSSASETVLSSRVAQVSFDCYQKVLEQGNALANTVLPADKQNGEALHNGFPHEAQPEKSSARGYWLAKETFCLFSRITHGVFGFAQSRADSFVNSAKKTL